ncbi:hypothetical protein ACFYNO_36625 [Kitasatospora sp. NPDC006697]|uniref:hypothetical protein n=1 Tax=Kitasatospora sp. NPDC006697 TaxID=3364020 RepID=UPI0036983C18
MEITESTAAPFAQQLADRYAAVWNEPDPERRRTEVARLWCPDAVHLLHPPQEVREPAAAIGFTDQALRAHGHAALEVRVARTYEHLVAPGTMLFRARPGALRVGDAVTFQWEALQPGTGQVIGGGVEFVLIAPDGRIARDYQFIPA